MPGDLQKALAAIDAAHSEDPNKITVDGKEIPYELHYAQKCTSYLSRRLQSQPSISDELQLAIRAQHLRRWEVPRSDYPDGRTGYLRWRSGLKTRQGEIAAGICREHGYNAEEAQRVCDLIKKENLKHDEETMALEDVACLVFLDDQFAAFVEGHDEDMTLKILQRTWGKMTEEGHRMALGVNVTGRAKEILDKALGIS